MIIPCGHRVVIKLLKPDEVDPAYKATTIYIPETQDKERREQSIDMGRVVAIGATAFKDFGGKPWCNIGDVVAFAKYAGKTVKDLISQEQFQVLNDEDVVCILTEEV